ncbi:MAG TPA: galactose-1-phosphate uridylyltransferase [Blastocatellia bacterium]|nr:galactose-1-phosphate uridylyltransferase [Blastocatellia bacterium]
MTWEQRWHPLREEWVVVAAHRQDRPWIGETIDPGPSALPVYLPDCYFCPGNIRISGARNENYTGTFVFDNDHPCVGADATSQLETPAGIFKNSAASGVARIVCYSPRHNLTLAELDLPEIERLLTVWQEQYVELGNRNGINHVLIFENKGDVVGVSNPHPHCQIYATNFIFKTIEIEARVSEKHFTGTGRVLFQDIIAAELEDGRRIIFENETAIAFLPYFARYAYETYVAPRRSHASIATMTADEIKGFAEAIKNLLVRLDNLWRMSFPYVLALHQAPTDGVSYDGFHFHIEIHPPLRRPNLLKYLAGPEIGGGNFLSDTAPEEKAAELRSQSDTHYKTVMSDEG